MRTLRFKLTLLLAGMAAFGVLTLAVLQVFFETQLVRPRVDQLNLQIVRLVSTQVEDQIGTLVQELLLLSTRPELVRAIAADDLERVASDLRLAGRIDPDVVAFSVIDTDGRSLATSLSEPAGFGTDVSSQHHFRETLLQNRPSIGDPRTGAVTGLPVIPVAVPIHGTNGEIVAVLQGTLSLSRLSQQLASIKVGESGYVSLLDGTGTILAHPNGSRILTSGTGLDDTVRQALEGETATVELANVDGARIFGAAAQIPSLGWIVLVQIPAEEALAPLRQTLLSAAGAAILALCLAVPAGMLMARQIVRPLSQLRSATRRLAGGDYTSQLPSIHTGDEIEDLAQDFGTMTTSLQSAIADLESRARDMARLYAEAEHQRSLAAAVIDSTDEAIVFVDPERRLRWVNRRVEAMFGLVPDQVLGHTFEDLDAEVAASFASPSAVRTLVSETVSDTERVLVDIVEVRSPEPRELALYSAPVCNSDGVHLGRLYMFRDVTQERALDRLKSEFVSLVSHELRTPITAIRGFVEVVLDGDAGEITCEQREFLSIAQRNTQRLTLLVNDLLDLAQIESGRVALDLQPVDLASIVEQVAESFRPQLAAKQQRLELRRDPALRDTLADPHRAAQIVSNLLSNAHKYTPEGGRITIRVLQDDLAIRCEVEDTGVGINSADIPKLFTKFFRAKNRATQEVSGTGLGLVVTRSLVELHGGEIAITSTPGRGTTCSFTLPAASVRPCRNSHVLEPAVALTTL